MNNLIYQNKLDSVSAMCSKKMALEILRNAFRKGYKNWVSTFIKTLLWMAKDLFCMKMRHQASNKQSLLPWQRECCDLKKGHFCAPPRAPNCMQNLKGGWKCSFPKMFDSYRDLFFRASLSIKSKNLEIHRHWFLWLLRVSEVVTIALGGGGVPESEWVTIEYISEPISAQR